MTFGRPPILFLDEHAPDLIRSYFSVGDDGPAFAGSQFDRLAADGNDPNRITAADLVALTLVDVPVSPAAAIWILGAGAGPIHALLRQIPNDVNLWTDEADVSRGSAADRLRRLLEQQPGIGADRAVRLCVRKRPRLLPAYDHTIDRALMLPEGELYWVTLRESLMDEPALVHRLNQLHAESGAPAEVAPLRLLEVAIWMRTRGKDQDELDLREVLRLPG